MPAGYALMAQTDVWRPYSDSAEYWRNDDSRDFIAMGRLKPGLTLRQAQAEMTGLARREAELYPKTHIGWTIHLASARLASSGQDAARTFHPPGCGRVRSCSSPAPMSPTCFSAAAPRGEKKWQCGQPSGRDAPASFAQLMTESVLISVGGGGIGLLLGAWGVQVILALSPPNIPRLTETTLDGRVFLFSLFIFVGDRSHLGLAPAW